MDPATFRALRVLAYEQAGLAIRENKEALVSARVGKRLRSLGLASERDYLQYLKADQSGAEMIHFLDAISTNFTSFYREAEHFALFREHVRERLNGGREKLRVWCAASSTGEEPYTLAMTIAEVVGNASVDWRVLGTDISVRVLKTASDGLYEEAKVRAVPMSLRARYFDREEDAASGAVHYRVCTALRRNLAFKRLNLAKPPFPLAGQLDAVFCRNVMIYFDSDVRARLIGEIERLLLPGGLLAIGHAETLNGISTRLRMVQPAVYRKEHG